MLGETVISSQITTRAASRKLLLNQLVGALSNHRRAL